MVTCF